MAIITLEQYKAIKGVRDNGNDSVIEALIPLIEEDYFHIRGKGLAAEEGYPLGACLVAADMIAHRLATAGSEGVSQQRIGEYSVTYADHSLGYPAGIVKRIKRYAEVHT